MIRFLVVLLVLLAPASAARADDPERITGRAVALDGDTLEIDGRRVRLWGIDAAEMKEKPAGPLARAALDDLVAGWTVACEVRDIDRYKRAAAICGTPEAADLSIAMLKAGQATAFRTFTAGWPEAESYDDAERQARMLRAGFWGDGGKAERDWANYVEIFSIPVGTLVALGTIFSAFYLQRRQQAHELLQRQRSAAGAAALMVQASFTRFLFAHRQMLHALAWSTVAPPGEDPFVNVDIPRLVPADNLIDALKDAPHPIALITGAFIDAANLAGGDKIKPAASVEDRIVMARKLSATLADVTGLGIRTYMAALFFARSGRMADDPFAIDIEGEFGPMLNDTPEGVLAWCRARGIEGKGIRDSWYDAWLEFMVSHD
jgi:endonuclease YncB( thermonuclease family)